MMLLPIIVITGATAVVQEVGDRILLSQLGRILKILVIKVK